MRPENKLRRGKGRRMEGKERQKHESEVYLSVFGRYKHSNPQNQRRQMNLTMTTYLAGSEFLHTRTL